MRLNGPMVEDTNSSRRNRLEIPWNRIEWSGAGLDREKSCDWGGIVCLYRLLSVNVYMWVNIASYTNVCVY